MKIAVLGGTGWLGAEITAEAIKRNHDVCVISRHPEDIKYTMTPEVLSLKADAANYDELVAVIPDDVNILINSLIPDPFVPNTFATWCENVIRCCKEKNINKLIAIGDACVFPISRDKTLMDTAFLTPFYRTWFGEHKKSHEVYLKETKLDWVEISPAAKCLPDKEKKEYNIAVDSLCTLDPFVQKLETPDPDQFPFADSSYISTQDFAYAVLDEIEQNRYSRTRICVAWKEKHEMYWKGESEE